MTQMLAERRERIDSTSRLVIMRRERKRPGVRVGEAAGTEDQPDWAALLQGGNRTGWVAGTRLRPDAVTVELDGVLVPLPWSQSADRHQRVVVVGDLKGARRVTEDPDSARLVRLDPDRRVVQSYVPEQRSQD